jgi:hypothetical protein
MSEKIRAQHLERKAVLYVRQSSADQVAHNLESQKLQMRWKCDCDSWGGARSRWWMRIWEDPPPGQLPE